MPEPKEEMRKDFLLFMASLGYKLYLLTEKGDCEFPDLSEKHTY